MHVEAIAARLFDTDAGCRKAALETLAQFGGSAVQYADAIAECLQDYVPFVRKAACQALGQFGNVSVHAGDIAALLNDPEQDVCEAAWIALENLGNAAEPHIETIAAQLLDKRPYVRRDACQALMRLGQLAAPHADLIAKLLMDDENSVREVACKALVQFQKTAVLHMVRLQDRSIADPSETVRIAAGETVRQVKTRFRKDVLHHHAKDISERFSPKGCLTSPRPKSRAQSPVSRAATASPRLDPLSPFSIKANHRAMLLQDGNQRPMTAHVMSKPGILATRPASARPVWDTGLKITSRAFSRLEPPPFGRSGATSS